MSEDDSRAILAIYQAFIDLYRAYRTHPLADEDGMIALLEAYDDTFDKVVDRNDDILELAIAAMRQDNQQQYEGASTFQHLRPVKTLRDRLRDRRLTESPA